jgi:S1-C subfamily serine protease
VSLVDVRGRTYCSGTVIENKAGKPLTVLTAAHCVEPSRPIFLSTNFDGSLRVMVPTKINEDVDLAVITSILAEDQDGPHVKLARKNPKVGSDIVCIGNPRGVRSVVTKGNLSKYQTIDGVLHFRSTADVFHGSSGGGMFHKGKLIGVVNLLEYGYRGVIVIDPDTGEIYQSNTAIALFPLPGGFLSVSLPEIKKFLKK